MKRFNYKAKDKDGKLVTGEVESINLDAFGGINAFSDGDCIVCLGAGGRLVRV